MQHLWSVQLVRQLHVRKDWDRWWPCGIAIATFTTSTATAVATFTTSVTFPTSQQLREQPVS